MSEESKILDEFKSSIAIKGRYRAHIVRADGSIEPCFGVPVGTWVDNQITYLGLNELAKLGIANGGSAFAYLSIGTVTATASLGSTVTGFGEISRKTPVTKTSSNEVFFMVMTWGGAADSITSVALGSAAMVNHASSGQGVAMNIVGNISATLANSDFVHIETQIQVGSHAL